MTLKEALRIALNDLSSQIACEDISKETRIDFQKAYTALLKFLKEIQ